LHWLWSKIAQHESKFCKQPQLQQNRKTNQTKKISNENNQKEEEVLSNHTQLLLNKKHTNTRKNPKTTQQPTNQKVY
jgi:hypothetical protein